MHEIIKLQQVKTVHMQIASKIVILFSYINRTKQWNAVVEYIF